MARFCEHGDEDSTAITGENFSKLLTFQRMHYYMRVSMLVLLITNLTNYMNKSHYSEANSRSAVQLVVIHGFRRCVTVFTRTCGMPCAKQFPLLKLQFSYRFRQPTNFIMQFNKL
jgi:hypothetical protein